MPTHYTLTLESPHYDRKFTVNVSVSDDFNPNDQKEIREHMAMQILYLRLCEAMFPYVPVINAKKVMMAAGLTEREFYELGIKDAMYPVDFGDNAEMTIRI